MTTTRDDERRLLDRVAAATTLEELAEALQDYTALVPTDDYHKVGEVLDLAVLPTFGGTTPEGDEIYSWDADHVLSIDTPGDWVIVTRHEFFGGEEQSERERAIVEAAIGSPRETLEAAVVRVRSAVNNTACGLSEGVVAELDASALELLEALDGLARYGP